MDGLMPVIAWGAGLFALFVVVAVGFSARSMVRPGRIKVWTDPKREFGADFESITFTTNDDVKLAGWFIPVPPRAARPSSPDPPPSCCTAGAGTAVARAKTARSTTFPLDCRST
jgi:hypothetical protein